MTIAPPKPKPSFKRSTENTKASDLQARQETSRLRREEAPRLAAMYALEARAEVPVSRGSVYDLSTYDLDGVVR